MEENSIQLIQRTLDGEERALVFSAKVSKKNSCARLAENWGLSHC